ncbi:DeoR/GlpR family DNA-binding transcription regulator [Actinoplanes sp. NPDC049596]|uniref:DeoR/GlpR family DNA-binding transcription regulator n=1 Tax=unclassified Actinoplanes TaxID=2626549 RepID=UPI00342C5427
MKGAEHRQARILAEINRTGGARIADLSRCLGVSEVTARRDVEVLAQRGLVTRVRGGAMARAAGSAVTSRPPVAGRRAKAAIARSAAQLVQPAQAVGLLAGGITTLVARELLGVPGLNVVTNAIPIADAFHRAGPPGQMVLLLGGVRTRSGALAGPLTERAAAGLNLDVVFVGAHGMAVGSGFTTPDTAEARTGAALIAAARRAVVVADHGRWGVSSAALIAPLERADVVVTDAGLAERAQSVLRRRVGRLIVAEVG